MLQPVEVSNFAIVIECNVKHIYEFLLYYIEIMIIKVLTTVGDVNQTFYHDTEYQKLPNDIYRHLILSNNC